MYNDADTGIKSGGLLVWVGDAERGEDAWGTFKYSIKFNTAEFEAVVAKELGF
jgi:hypothetical protein